MDEGESNSEPAESMIMMSKENEEKDPLSIALPETPSSDTQTKEDHVENDQRSPSDVATPDDEADIPAQSSKIAPDEDGESEKKPAASGEPKSNDVEPGKENVKEQEMLSKLANMKQEVNSAAAPAASNDADFASKDSVFIKKEPNEEVAAGGGAGQEPSPNQAPTDLKVKVEVKSETTGKSGPNSTPSDNSNQMPNDQDNNNNAENLVCKPLQKFAAGGSSSDGSAQPKTPESRSEGADYSMKSFMERDGVKMEQHGKNERSPTDGPKPFERDHESKFGPEHGPPGMLRHPFDPLMKFDPMMKYDMPLGMDLKYLPPDHPARAYADNALKSQFSADNLIKGASHYPQDIKYPPPPSTANETPIDASSRITPNQDSQGSNSNSQPATLPSPSPLSSQPSLIPSFVGHPGLNLSGHLPANHPSLMSSSGPPMGSASLPPTSGSSPFLPIQGGLHRPEAISTGSRTYPTSTSTTAISSLSSAGSAFGPGPGNPLYATSRLSENHRDGLHRTSPLGPLLHGSPHPLLSHPLPLHHLGHPGIGLTHHHPAHLPPHLHNHLMQPLGPNTPLPLIGGPQPSSNPLSSLIEAAGRGTPTSAPSSISHMVPSSQHNSVIQSSTAQSSLNSSLSRTSPLVHPSAGGAFSHRPQSPSSNHPANLSRNSPLHLGGQPIGPSPAAMSAERERQLMRQQSPHMTPPPTSSANSLNSSPLNKMYGPPGSQPGQRPNSPPPSHFRPGASPPVVRHPSMPLAMPMLQSPVMHPSQSPYPHHLLHPSMFYAAHNPFNSPYPYSAYGPPPGAYSYIKGGGPLDGALLQHHHPTSIPPPRSDEPPSPHSNGPKSVSNLHDKIKSPAPSKSSQNSNHAGGNSSAPSGPHPGGPYSSPYPPSHPFMENTLPPGKTSHIEALRAHAASAAGMGSGGHHPTEPVHIDAVDIEPDPEPPSPVHPIDRGPSPEAKPDDTECHRSQSAM